MCDATNMGLEAGIKLKSDFGPVLAVILSSQLSYDERKRH